MRLNPTFYLLSKSNSFKNMITACLYDTLKFDYSYTAGIV